MILLINFKTPDVLDYALGSYIDEKEGEESDEKAELKKKLAKWIEYGENVTLQYDSEKDELTVKKINE